MRIRGLDCRGTPWEGWWTGRVDHWDGIRWYRAIVHPAEGLVCFRWLKEIEEVK